MNLQPKVSVVMSVFNGERYLQEAIDSVLYQSFVDFELIIVDDGSTDQSKAIISSYTDKRIILIENKENIGLAASLNKGIDVASSEYIARMDCDDVCHKNRLAIQYEFMQCHPSIVILGSAALFIDKLGVRVCGYFPPIDDLTLRKVFPGSPFVHPSVMFRKNVFYQAGKYPQEMRLGGEDPVLFSRMSKFGELGNLSELLINYRLVPGAMSRKPVTFRSMLTKIIEDKISGNLVTDERFEALKLEAKKIDKSKAIFDYHFEVAKLYIWSGRDRMKAFKHLSKCIFLKDKTVKVLILYLVTILPKFITTKVYFKLKGRRFA